MASAMNSDSEELLTVLFGSVKKSPRLEVIFKGNKSDTGCDLPDNEGTVDLIKYLDSPDTDDEMSSVVSSSNDSTPNRSPSPDICPPPSWSTFYDEFDAGHYYKNGYFIPGFMDSSIETDGPCICCSPPYIPSSSSSIFTPEDPNLVYPNPNTGKSQVPSSVNNSSKETSNYSKSQVPSSVNNSSKKTSNYRQSRFHTTNNQPNERDFHYPAKRMLNHYKVVQPGSVYSERPDIIWTPSSEEDSSEETVPDKNVFIGWIKKEEPDDEFKPLQDINFPDSSTGSDTATGDNSDVDVETIPEAPKSADLWESNIQYSSPAASSLSSPEVVIKFKSNARVATTSKRPRGGKQLSAARTQKASASQSTSRASSSTSQVENVDAKQCVTLGQKRKLAKDKKLTKAAQSQSAYTRVLCSSNSVNFHDYAMSPMACTSPSATETVQSTVQATRIYRRNTAVEAIDKDKQNHHNQLERNRRQKLADLFTDLRDQVPTLTGNAKASKVHILKEAALHVHYLQRKSKSQEDDIYRENRKQQLLRSQLRQLQAQICSRVK